ncbi:hypothetical protein PILCRDRAFT_86558 [Piloderma croceum F 1598]|uniref:Uncharacterized protein n=1 Tax=Piloderma croceum (strain F 1598) TaxID=765440 RepID=A0A0C3C9I2_PILCF|nr:hypothetical protein PILCRDRAFT_86558 [Piloderma croceum F 1598]
MVSTIIIRKKSSVQVAVDTDSLNHKEFCSFCADTAKVLRCRKPTCELKICIQKTGGQLPCIVASTFPKDETTFWCPKCCHNARIPTPSTSCKKTSEARTMCCYQSGGLVHGQDINNVLWISLVDQVYKKFTRENIREALDRSRGVKGLFLMACGMAFTNATHFSILKGLVDSGKFTFLLGFRAFTILPRNVMATAVVFLCSVFIDQTPIWDACVMAFTANLSVLQTSPLVIVYCEGTRTVLRTLVYSQPKDGV